MSKMFENLRRAEQARRRKNGGRDDATAVEETARSTRPQAAGSHGPSRNGSGELPEGFARELGILRNSVDTALKGKERQVLVFTSASHEEGVTTVSSSYARLCSMSSEKSVVLIELNARRPSLFWRMGMSSDVEGAGVSHFLDEDRALSSIVHSDPRVGFDVVHVGERDPERIQLHLERRMPELIAQAAARYDTVVIDAPPVVLAPETPRIAAHADGVVMVVYCGRTRREIVQRSIHMVEEFDGNVLGVVLNRKKYYIPEFLYQRL